jgi:preprotein translocase subunit SecE
MASIASNPLINYLKTSYKELKKVTWPTREEAAKHALYVILMSVVVAIFFGVIDYLLTYGIEIIVS